MKTALYGVAAALAAFLAPAAHTAEIRIIASNAVREPYLELIPVFEKETGHRVAVDWGGTLDIVKRVGSGEVADIVIIPAARIDTFVTEGKLTGRVDIAKSGVGVAMRTGLPRPDISTADALKRTLLAAKSIVLSSGPSSFYLPTLFEKMGIAAELKPKIIQIAPGLGVGATLARGEGEIGFTQMSELMSVKGIDYLGPLPPEVQFVTIFSAGIHTGVPAAEPARALLKFLTGPHVAPVLRQHGMEPG
jgi:molybdate transport system substrate-binding protein